ncbi:MAG: Bcr/CflA family multidrug efflux MFS transporter [Aliivibrio sp.]|uniref:purine nucleoside transporter PunC n=1 Tax=Aliivibrio sp. TaxID=1872443 RepID=UPI001A3C5A9B|nr:Bcr/CflA family multidrug efflux MFS transporter [Aliivibrio sp.]
MKNKNSAIPYIWLAGLSMLGFMATDMYLPAFEVIRQELETSEQMIGWTLTLFLLGMAGGQLLYGPLINKFGMKKTLCSGLVVFSIGSAICGLSSSVEVLLTGRFLQALGACGATVIWQSYVIDNYEARTSQRIFASIMPLVALSPALAPLLGAALERHFGWQTIFYTLILIGIALIARSSVMDFSPKYEKLKLDSQAVNFPLGIIKQYREILASKIFTGNMIIYASCSAAFFAWLTGSPFIMHNMGYSGADIGLSYVPQTIAFIIGGYGCRVLLNRHAPGKILPWLLKLFIFSVFTLFLIAIRIEQTSIIPLLIPMCFMAAANGAIYPLVANSALAEFKSNSASASGLMNFLQMMFCVISSGLVSVSSGYGSVAMTGVMAAQGLLVLMGYVLIITERRSQTVIPAIEY